MRHFIFILLVSLSWSIQAQAQSRLIKGFDALEIYNYFEAKHQFQKAQKKYPCGASFGLSKIYLNDKNPFHNLDSARIYGLKSKATWTSTSEKIRVQMIPLNVDSMKIQAHLDSIAAVAFERLKESQTLSDYERFLEDYAWSKDTSTARVLRNVLAYNYALSENTAKGYREFIDTYPQAIQIDQAKEKYDLRLFEESTSINRIEDYSEFVLSHPDSPYREQAEDQIYSLATASGKTVDYLMFIRKHPTNRHLNEAWYEVYKQRTQWMNVELLMDFLLDFPMYPFREAVIFEIAALQNSYFPARNNNRWGLIDATGTWMVDPTYDYCEPFAEGMALFEKNGLFGYIDVHGQEVIKAIYEEAYLFDHGVAIVFNGLKYGTINRFGEIVVPFEYDEIGDYNDGLALALKNGNYGYINLLGQSIIPFDYQKAYTFNHNRALVQKNNRFGVINSANKVILPFIYDWIEPDFGDSLIKVKQNNFFGIIKQNRDTVLPMAYDYIGRLQSMILVVKDEKAGYISRSGEWLIPLKYGTDPFISTWGEYENGSIRIKYRSKMGVIDSTDQRLVPAIFEDIGVYRSPLYAIRKKDKWGYADEKVKLIIPYLYEAARAFNDSLAWVKKEGRWGMIDLSGNPKTSFEFMGYEMNENLYVVENDTAFGLLNLKGKSLLPTVYSSIAYNSKGYFVVVYQNKLAYLDPRSIRFFWRESGFSEP